MHYRECSSKNVTVLSEQYVERVVCKKKKYLFFTLKFLTKSVVLADAEKGYHRFHSMKICLKEKGYTCT